jgi:hypothetical protein
LKAAIRQDNKTIVVDKEAYDKYLERFERHRRVKRFGRASLMCRLSFPWARYAFSFRHADLMYDRKHKRFPFDRNYWEWLPLEIFVDFDYTLIEKDRWRI